MKIRNRRENKSFNL